jgi:hypothetical protein
LLEDRCSRHRRNDLDHPSSAGQTPSVELNNNPKSSMSELTPEPKPTSTTPPPPAPAVTPEAQLTGAQPSRSDSSKDNKGCGVAGPLVCAAGIAAVVLGVLAARTVCDSRDDDEKVERENEAAQTVDDALGRVRKVVGSVLGRVSSVFRGTDYDGVSSEKGGRGVKKVAFAALGERIAPAEFARSQSV